MPSSAVMELDRQEHWNGKIKFWDSKNPDVKFTITEEIWIALDRPDKLRVRIEDTWNDPDRKW